MASFLALVRNDLLFLKDILASLGFVLQIFIGGRGSRMPCRAAGGTRPRSIRLSPGWRYANHRRASALLITLLYTPSVTEVNGTKVQAISDRGQGVIVTGRVHGNIATFAAPSRHEALPRVGRLPSTWPVLSDFRVVRNTSRAHTSIGRRAAFGG